jgi:hypothetical protein
MSRGALSEKHLDRASELLEAAAADLKNRSSSPNLLGDFADKPRVYPRAA